MKVCVKVCLIFLLVLVPQHVFSGVTTQDDTVKAKQITELPVIDGNADDNCWSNSAWQYIDQVWITYGEVIDSTDFWGRYKVCWSATSNLIYFLVEVVDDVFVDGYVYNSDPSLGGGYPNYDIVEVFIDQDNSGGLHVFDGTGSTGQQWGTNAENAFSYHIAVNLLQEEQTVTEKVVCDIAGTGWDNYHISDYGEHFPNFALKYSADKYVWEFSMAVYDDSYDHADPSASRVNLKLGDVMGLSIAYCDNDDPNEEPKKRDHFIGSVWVPQEAYNDHWMNADGFGTLQLVGITTGMTKNARRSFSNVDIYPNPNSGFLNYNVNGNHISNIKFKIYNILGQKVLEINNATSQVSPKNQLSLKHLPTGIYFFSAKIDNHIVMKKFVIIQD